MDMELRDYLRTLTADQKREYARRCGTTVAYLKQLSGGHSIAGPALAKRLHINSGRAVPLHRIRSDIWSRNTKELRV